MINTIKIIIKIIQFIIAELITISSLKNAGAIIL